MGFSERFPRWITAVIGIAQVVITAAIIALELVSCYIDLAHGTIWAGLWSGLVFIITFLSMLFISKSFFEKFLFLNLIFFFLQSLLLSWSLLCLLRSYS
jgi:hypothetical protein